MDVGRVSVVDDSRLREWAKEIATCLVGEGWQQFTAIVTSTADPMLRMPKGKAVRVVVEVIDCPPEFVTDEPERRSDETEPV